jgi:16S rRNA processing protein RimM
MLMKWEEMALVGRIARAHGLRGQVIVNPETDFLEQRFQPGAELFVNRAGAIETLVMTSVRFQHDRPVIGIRGIDDLNAAMALAGTELRVPVDRLSALPEGAFYRHDLIGCSVETVDGSKVGVVNDVEGTIGRSHLIIDTDAGEVMIPLASEICTTIDPGRKRIVIAPPEGLLGLNARSV